MGPDLLLRKELDHRVTELSPELANTATDKKARKMVFVRFSYMFKYIFKNTEIEII